ncbi:MAG: hypothetical protein A07HN63_01763 [uncultured archaeon A07HN63]|nr:MAG: hypothetical protein A07HN63_01763 [uncultured archaeon A07HN63]
MECPTMKNQPITDGGTPTVDTEALGSWVAETAAEKGVSERELLDEILSSYWVLEELSDVIVDPDGDGPPREGRPRGRANESQAGDPSDWEPQQPGEGDEADDEEETLELSGIEQELEKLRTVVDELSDEESLPSPEDEQPTGSEPTQPSNQQPQQQSEAPSYQQSSGHAQQPNSQPQQQPGGQSTTQSQPTQQPRGSQQPQQQSNQQSQPQQQPNQQSQPQQPTQQSHQQPTKQSQQQPSTQPQQSNTSPQQQPGGGSESVDPDDGFDEFTSAAVGEAWGESSGAIDELDAELDEVRHRITELETAVNEQLSGEATDLDNIEAWIQNEFDNIEDVLEHLLSKTDNLEYRIGSAVDSQREQLEPLQEAHAEQENLTALKAEAIRKDVDTAACSDCGESVDLGVLPTPYCPNCEQKLTGVEAGQGWNPFDKPTLRTAPTRPAGTASAQQSGDSRGAADRGGQHGDGSPPPQQAGDERQEPRSDGGFEWVDN